MAQGVHTSFIAAAIGLITVHGSGVLVASFIAAPIIIQKIIKVLASVLSFVRARTSDILLDIIRGIVPVRGPPVNLIQSTNSPGSDAVGILSRLGTGV